MIMEPFPWLFTRLLKTFASGLNSTRMQSKGMAFGSDQSYASL
jgi:hypothetical protein